jgi:hypothetical protein
MEVIERNRGLPKFMLHSVEDAHVYQRKHAPVIPFPSGFAETRTPSVYAQLSPAYVFSRGNPMYLAPEKIGYPKDPTLKKMELLVGLGYYKDVERDPSAAKLPLFLSIRLRSKIFCRAFLGDLSRTLFLGLLKDESRELRFREPPKLLSSSLLAAISLGEL